MNNEDKHFQLSFRHSKIINEKLHKTKELMQLISLLYIKLHHRKTQSTFNLQGLEV